MSLSHVHKNWFTGIGMNVREIDTSQTSGVYILAGRLAGSSRKTSHFYVGESINVHLRLRSHQKVDEQSSDVRRRNNYDRWFGRKSRMVLLNDIEDQKKRRDSEERFMAAAIMLGLPLLNIKQPYPYHIQLLGALDSEIATLREALDFLNIDCGQYKPVVFPFTNLIVLPRAETIQEATA